MSLDERVIIVTGAGSGIGRETAKLLSSMGARVVIAEIKEASGRSVFKEIEAAGGSARFIQTDVANEQSVQNMIDETVSTFGPLYGLVNNAGIDLEGELAQLPAADWDRILAVNLRSVFLCSRAAIPYMKKSQRGSIVNIASVHANFGFVGYSAYDASKGGIVALTRTLAVECGPSQIRANAICPGYIDTPMWDTWLATQPDPATIEKDTQEWHPLRRRGRPLDIAKAVRFLLSDEAEWVTGISLVVDGGMSARFFGH